MVIGDVNGVKALISIYSKANIKWSWAVYLIILNIFHKYIYILSQWSLPWGGPPEAVWRQHNLRRCRPELKQQVTERSTQSLLKKKKNTFNIHSGSS